MIKLLPIMLLAGSESIYEAPMCVLVFISYGHLFLDHRGSWFHKVCRYHCEQPHPYGWDDIFFRVSPSYVCPARFATT